MKIDPVKQLDIQDIAGEFESKEASIDKDSMPFLFEMMSKSLYSNPIGSICREITSNCFDSHKEAEVTKPVVISKRNDDEGTYISFKDSGVGLSPDRINNIYMNYFSSTKRNTNDQIGGFGLGSKTPLSYTDSFYIISIHDKIKYEYIFSKGERVPTLDLLTEDSTDLPNGVEIKIYIHNSNDIDKFEEELKKQLCYFDDVYFVGWNINNTYKIYETETYKYKNVDQYSDEMHICLGKVPYPINWKEIDEIEINASVGVKFEIGELVVTPNREQLRYTDEVKKLVKERVLKVKEELIKTFNEQNVPITDFLTWYKSKDSKPFIGFGEHKADKLYLIGFKEIVKKNKFALFQDINYYYNNPKIFNALYDSVKYISGGEEQKRNHNSPMDAYEGYAKYSVVKHIATSKVKNAFHRVLTLCKRTDPSPREFKEEFITYTKKRKRVNLSWAESNDSDAVDIKIQFGDHCYFNLGMAKKIYEINKQLRSIFESDNKCINYDDVPSDFITKWRKEQRDNDATLQRKLEGKVFIKTLNGYEFDWKISGQMPKSERQVVPISKHTGIVVYGGREDRDKLNQAYDFLMNFESLRTKYKISSNVSLNPKAAEVIIIARQNEKYFKNRENMVHVDKLYSDHKLFRQLASTYKIEDFFVTYLKYQTIDADSFVKEITNICTGVGENLKTLLRYRSRNYKHSKNGGIDNHSDLKEMVLEIAHKHNYFDPLIEEILDKVNKWFEEVEILKYTEINKHSLPAILVYLKDKGKKLNTEYYLKYVYEEELKNKKNQHGQIILMFPEERPEVQGSKFKVLTQQIA